ncbi:hypothetical protein LCGC14_2873610, partial [marine sediment metagenome]
MVELHPTQFSKYGYFISVMEIDHHILCCLVDAEASEGCLDTRSYQFEVNFFTGSSNRITHEPPDQGDFIRSYLTQGISSSFLKEA